MKRFITLLLAVCLTVGLCAGARAASLEVNDVEATDINMFELRVSLAGNPGVAGIAFSVCYDAANLVLIDCQQASLGDRFEMIVNGEKEGEYKIAFVAAANVTADGDLVALRFRVLDPDAGGDRRISLDMDQANTYNEALQDVKLEVVSASANVRLPEPVETLQ